MPETDYIEAAQEIPTTKPAGAPDLTPLLQLPRRQRADVLRKLGELRERQAKTPAEATPTEGEATAEQEKAGLDRAAAMFDLLADFEELLRMVAVDVEHFDAWNANANDADLSQLAGYYMRTFQAGEAQASPTS